MKTYYGVFYKNKGKWVGPYQGELWDDLELAKEELIGIRSIVKQKVELREEKWVKVHTNITT